MHRKPSLWRHDIQHQDILDNGTQHNCNTQHKDKALNVVTLSVTFCYATLNVIRLSVVMLSVAAPSLSFETSFFSISFLRYLTTAPARSLNRQVHDRQATSQSYKKYRVILLNLSCKLYHFINVQNCLSVAKQSSLWKVLLNLCQKKVLWDRRYEPILLRNFRQNLLTPFVS